MNVCVVVHMFMHTKHPRGALHSTSREASQGITPKRSLKNCVVIFVKHLK